MNINISNAKQKSQNEGAAGLSRLHRSKSYHHFTIHASNKSSITTCRWMSLAHSLRTKINFQPNLPFFDEIWLKLRTKTIDLRKVWVEDFCYFFFNN